MVSYGAAYTLLGVPTDTGCGACFFWPGIDIPRIFRSLMPSEFRASHKTEGGPQRGARVLIEVEGVWC